MEEKISFSIMFFMLSSIGFAQVVELNGKVTASSDVEGIHVINKASKFYTTTNKKGKFVIKAKLNDTLVFSAVQYKSVSVKITQKIIDNKTLTINLNELVNELEEVVVGKILTGNLEDDIKVYNVKPDINFYDVGIPGYTGKPMTKNERLLNEAGEFKPIQLLGILGGSVPLNPILNGISGRTKMLKNRIKLDKQNELMFSVKAQFSTDFFSAYPLPEDNKMDFFYFCSEDPDFENRCKDKSDVEIFEYLTEKYNQYQENQNGDKN